MSSPGDVLGVPASGTAGPPRQSGHVRRERLLQRLRADPGSGDVVLLVAPAGYGKTTFLSQWAGQDGHPYAWVTVEDVDNDPVSLLRRVALALHQVTPVGDDVLESLVTPDLSPLAVMVPRLLDWLARRPDGGVLVLDDLHVLNDPASLAVVAGLARGLPSRWRLAVASRRRPGVNLVPLRGGRRYLELGRADLAFDVREAALLLEDTSIGLPDDVVESLVRRVEGWPAAIYLTALSIQANADPAATAARTATGDAPLSEDIRAAVLDQLPEATVEFLRRTSVLERLSGPLCDAVTRTAGSATRLAELEQSNLLVVLENPGGEGWYRCHRLLADVLRTELRRGDAETEPRLHRRATAWFEEHDRPEEAIAHALAGDDVPTAARLVTSCGQRLANSGRVTTVRRWVEAIGSAGVRAYPPFAVVAAWLWAVEGEGVRARQLLATAERSAFDGRPADASASFESQIALLRAAMAPAGAVQMMRDARRAMELEPPGSPWYPLACAMLGMAHLLQGADDAAGRAFERTAYFGQGRHGSAVALAHAELAVLAAGRDDWVSAAGAVREALTTMKHSRLQESRQCAVIYAVAARVAAHERDRTDALFNVSSALRLTGDPARQVALPWLSAQTHLVLGQTLLELGDHTAAQRMVLQARRQLARMPVPGILREQVQTLEATIARRREPPDAPPVLMLTAAEGRVLQLLPTHLTLSEISRELGISRNTAKTHAAAIYRKIGARNRAEAVRVGRELGLLGE